MKTFEVTAPWGKTYEVTGPDDATQDQAIAQVQAQHGQDAPTQVIPRGMVAPGMEPVQMPGKLDQANAIATGGVRGLTMGWDDELLGSKYAAERERVSAMYPGAHLAGNIAGGLYGGAGMGAAMGGTARGKAALEAFNKASLAGKAGRLAGSGAVFGAIGGAGEAEPGNRMAGAAAGAGTGAALGVVVPAVIGAAGWGAGKIANVADRIRQPEQYALRRAGQALADDNLGTGYVRSKLRQAGGQGTIAESAGRNVEGFADTVAALPGPAQQAATKTFRGRLQPQKVQQRFESELLGAIGSKNVNTHDAMLALHDNMSRLGPAYEQAVETGAVPMTADMKKMADTPLMKEAISYARRMVANDIGIGDADRFFNKYFREAGGDVIEEPTLRAWDYVRRALSAKIDSSVLPNGKLTAEGRQAVIMKQRLSAQMGKANPTYAKVVAEYADQKAGEDALNLGKMFLREDSDELASVLEGMTGGERKYFTIGAARALRDKVLGSGTPSTALRDLQRGPMAAKVRQAFPDEQSYQKFMRALRNEATFANAPNRFGRGSATAARQEIMRGEQVPQIPRNFGGLISAAISGANRRLNALPPEGRAALAPLFSTDPMVQQQFLQAMQAAQATRGARGALSPIEAAALMQLSGQAGRAGGLLGGQ